tara:strand:+ start:426 stop:710 length:285 start_codon:yes stop_codon:yes gene_type:complete
MERQVNTSLALKVALWCVPVLFGAGSLFQMVAGSSAQVAEVAADIEEHEALEAHPVTRAKLEIIHTEQRAMRDDVARQAASIAAICQATGASCR